MPVKKIIRNVLGRFAISLAGRTPQARRFLAPIGLRCSQDSFGDRIVEIPRPEGRPLRLTRLDDCYLAFQLFWRGIDFYEPITRALIKELIRPGGTFMDLGAHVGFFSLHAGLSAVDTRIISFEPNPKNFEILKANMAANNLPNIVCEPIAVSDRTGSAALYLTESDMSASLMRDFQSEDTVQVGQIEVPTTTLDAYLETHPVKDPLLIKVDIEGHEGAFFRGAIQTLATRKPDIILEVLYDQDPGLVTQLKSLGYHFYPITDEGLVEMDAPKLVKRFPLLFMNHLLSVRPKSDLTGIFNRAREATRHINLLQTSKHFPPAEWPALWVEEKG